jgi:hypothetical protein
MSSVIDGIPGCGNKKAPMANAVGALREEEADLHFL